MSAPRYPLVVFDFDGTLADSFPWFAGILNEVAVRYRFRQVAEHETALLRDLDARAIVRHLGIPAWKLPLITRHMHALATRDIDAIRPFPGMRSLLTEVENGGIRLGIVSSNTEANIRTVLGRESADRIAHYACGASLFGKARRLKGLVRAAGFAPGQVLYVGDEIRDALAARAAGCDFGAVAWGYTNPSALAAHHPSAIFETPSDIAYLVCENAVHPQGVTR